MFKMKNILGIAMMLFVLVALNSCGGGAKKATQIVIETEYGNMVAELYDSTPKHKENFIKLINESFYDDLLFHRVIQGFMIQGGDPDSRGAEAGRRLGGGGPGYLIDAEIGSPHFKGTLAAARTGNPEKRSSGSQFYVVHGRPQSDAQLNQMESQKGIKYTEEQRARYKEDGGTPMLDSEYTVFGEVIKGFEVIDKIAATATDPSDRPLEDVKMKIRLN